MSILFYKSFFLDIVNSENVDSDNISTETSNCDPSSAEIDVNRLVFWRVVIMAVLRFLVVVLEV